MTKPLVLLSNDDGYRSDGIRAMASALREKFEVVICAPDSEQSASSHSLSLNRPLRIIKHGDGEFSVDGTPADSIYVALHEKSVLGRRPNLIVSGMNHGLNLGQDVFYSGTVAAAREGALQGYPSLAVSAHDRADLARAAADAVTLALSIVENHDGKPILLNANYPPHGTWEKIPCVSGRRHYTGGLVSRRDPRGRPYYWIGGDTVKHDVHVGTDTKAYDSGLVGITPLCLDLSAGADLPQIELLCSRLNA